MRQGRGEYRKFCSHRIGLHNLTFPDTMPDKAAFIKRSIYVPSSSIPPIFRRKLCSRGIYRKSRRKANDSAGSERRLCEHSAGGRSLSEPVRVSFDLPPVISGAAKAAPIAVFAFRLDFLLYPLSLKFLILRSPVSWRPPRQPASGIRCSFH